MSNYMQPAGRASFYLLLDQGREKQALPETRYPANATLRAEALRSSFPSKIEGPLLAG